ncbi:MAG: hypothetical protein LBH94_07585 [Deltaproteobacteria bacterium]|nr:hypothetical protein [Deltaproteobacteria bacterium]
MAVKTARLLAGMNGETLTALEGALRPSPDGMSISEARAFDPQARWEQANANIERMYNEVDPAVEPHPSGVEQVEPEAGRPLFHADMQKLEKSMQAVRAHYDGTNAWMKAPNGQPTNLTEQQWLIVRTPEFKQWFGDWEYSSIKQFLDGKPIQELRADSAPTGNFQALTKWAADIFASQGGKAISPILGEVILSAQSARSSLAHGGANQYKRVAFAAVKNVIEQGRLIHESTMDGKKGYYIAAPVSIDGGDNIVVMLVRQRENDKRFYLHAVGTKESLLQNRVSDSQQNADHSSTSSGDVYTVLRNIMAVNPDSVSKAVDANGEPLMQQRQSGADIEAFDPRERDAELFKHKQTHARSRR